MPGRRPRRQQTATTAKRRYRRPKNHGGAGPAKRYSNRRKQPARRFPQNRPTRQGVRGNPPPDNSPRSPGRRGGCSGNPRRSTTAPPAAAHGVPDKASGRQNSPTPSAILPERPTAAGRPLHSHSGRCQYRFRGGRRRSGNHARRLRFPPFARLQLP